MAQNRPMLLIRRSGLNATPVVAEKDEFLFMNAVRLICPASSAFALSSGLVMTRIEIERQTDVSADAFAGPRYMKQPFVLMG
jgi:hypothetical protein